MSPMTLALEKLAAGETLSTAESEGAVASILDGESTESAVVFVPDCTPAPRRDGPRAGRGCGAVRQRMTPLDTGASGDRLIDTCGTGGDCAETINVSTAAAIVVAACGVPVVKHGNRASSSRSGSSDVLSALGIATDLEPVALRRCLAELNITFLLAPRFHPGLARVAAVRRQLPFRTLFNLIGPLCNPAAPPFQLIGAPTGRARRAAGQRAVRTGTHPARGRRHRQRRS